MFLLLLPTFCFLSLFGKVYSFEFSNGLITLPEYTLNANEDIKVSMRKIVCHNLTVGDVDIKSQLNGDNVLLSAEIQAVGLVCRMDLTLKLNDIEADAQAFFETNDTDIASQMSMTGDVLRVDECLVNIRLSDMEITGLTGVVAVFVDSMRDTWMEGMETALGMAVCDQLKEAIPNLLGGNVKVLSALFTRLAEANAQEWTPSLQIRTDNPALVRLDESESSIEIVTQLAWLLSSYFLNSTKEDGSLVVNSVARQLFRDNSNAYQMENLGYSFDFKASILGDWGLDSLEITGGYVLGLDSIVEFNEIIPTSPTSLQTSVMLQTLQINLDAVLNINETIVVDGTIVDSALIADDFQIELSLNNVVAMIDLNLELLSSYLADIRVGALLASPSITPCLLGAIQNASIANIRFETIDYQAPTVTNLDPVLQKLLTGSIDFLMAKYAEVLPGVIGSLVNNAVLQAQLPFEVQENATCDFSSDVGKNAEHVDFRDLLLAPEHAREAGASGKAPYGSRVYTVKDFVDRQLLQAKPGTDRPFLNEKAPASTRQSGTPGTFMFTGSKAIFSYKDVITIGNSTIPIQLGVKNLTLENVNNWLSPMVILDPVIGEASGFSNLVQFGTDEDPSLKMSTIVELTIGDDLSNDFVVSMEVKSLSLLVDLFLYIREDPFLHYRLGDIKNGHCLASLLEMSGIQESARSETGVPPFDLSAFDMQLKGVKMDVQCQSCRDGTTEVVAEVASRIVDNLFADGLYFHMGYNELAEKDEKRNIVSEWLNTVESRSLLLQDFFDKFIADSPKMCWSNPEYDPNTKAEGVGLFEKLGFELPKASPRSEILDFKGSTSCQKSLIVIASTLICSWLLVRAYMKYQLVQRQRVWLSALLPSQVIAIYERQEKLKNQDFIMNQCCPPIFSCEKLSRPRKVSVAIALVGTIILFVMGISNTAASITVDLYTSNALTYSFSVDYTLMTIVELTWESGGYFMALATAFVVGIWPMVRQFMTLFLLFIPSTYVDIKQRGQMLFLLDQVGKWSMLVIFLSMLNTAAFFTTVESPADSLLPFKVQLMYVPLWGTYATFLGQLISYNLASIILEFHRLSLTTVEAKMRGPGSLPTADGEEDVSSAREEESKQDVEDQVSSTVREKKKEERYQGQSTCLATTQFARVVPYCNNRWAVRPSVQKLLFTTAVGVAVPLLITGSITTSYSSKLEGILNDAFQLGNVSVKMSNDHSVFSVMGALLDQAISLNEPLHYLGHGLMMWFLFLSVVFAPVLLIALLLVLWFLPLTISTRRKLNRVARRVFSWQGTEIYIIATLVGAWQMDDLASYMTSSMCWAFDPLIDFLSRNGWISPSSQCFGIQGNVGGGAIALFVGCVLLYILLSFVSSAQKQKTCEEELLALVSTVTKSGNQSPVQHAASRAKEIVEAIDLLPVLFTDKFSWLLKEAES